MALRARKVKACAKRYDLALCELCGLIFFSINSVLNLICLIILLRCCTGRGPAPAGGDCFPGSSPGTAARLAMTGGASKVEECAALFRPTPLRHLTSLDG